MSEIKTYPYTFDQLKFFQKEIEEAGGVDELMIKKEALKRTNDMTIISIFNDIEGYRQKYLIGVYESLRSNYNTEVPYVFWGKLYEMLQRI
jgi:hypothetical protein